MQKIYNYYGGEHRFDDSGKYLGFWDSQGKKYENDRKPFDSWEQWDEKKHKLLTETLGFTFINTD